MKAVLLKSAGRVAIEELARPRLSRGDILVEMKVCGLCGTDVEKIRGEYTAAPLVLGHEASGIVVEVGEGVEDLKIGERIFPHHHVPCYECYFCRHGSETMCPHYRANNLDPGGFSEYFRVPAWNIQHGGALKLPSHVTFEEASLIEPTACCIRSLNRSRAAEGETTLIVGAGPMGLIHLQLLKMLDARVLVSDINTARLKFAERMGASSIINPAETDVSSKVKGQTEGRGADLAVVASGSSKAIVQALRSVRRGGRVCLFGVPVKGSVLDYDFSDVFNSEVSMISSNAATEAETRKALELIAGHRLNLTPLITHRFRLEEFKEAVETAVKGDGLKIVVTP